MQELLETLDEWRAEGAGVGRAVVVRDFGSAPRPEGAVLLAGRRRPDRGLGERRLRRGRRGGGDQGRPADGRQRVIRYGISDEQAWDVGLACGGTIDVLVEPVVPAAAAEAARETREGRSGGRRWSRRSPPTPRRPSSDRMRPGQVRRPELRSSSTTRAPGRHPGLRRRRRGARRGGPGRPRRRHLADGRDRGAPFFIEAYPVRPRLVVVGAVEVARTLVRLAKELGYETVVIDGRAAFATAARFPDVDRLVVGWPDEVADEIGLGPSDAVAVLTHDVKFDEPAIVEALERGCRYVGAVGSRRTQAERRARLLAAGVPPADLARLQARSGSTLAGACPPRRPSRSWPRSSPSDEVALVVRCGISPVSGGRPPREGRRRRPGRRPVVALRLAQAAGRLAGRPVLQHVLDAVAAAGVDDVAVVLGDEHEVIEAAIAWRGERRVINERPGDGLSSSLRVGLDAAAEDAGVEAVLVVLGDQPTLRPEVIRSVLGAAGASTPCSSVPAMPPTAPRTRSSSAAQRGRWPRVCPATAGSGPCSPPGPSWSSRCRSRAPTRMSTRPMISSPCTD